MTEPKSWKFCVDPGHLRNKPSPARIFSSDPLPIVRQAFLSASGYLESQAPARQSLRSRHRPPATGVSRYCWGKPAAQKNRPQGQRHHIRSAVPALRTVRSRSSVLAIRYRERTANPARSTIIAARGEHHGHGHYQQKGPTAHAPSSTPSGASIKGSVSSTSAVSRATSSCARSTVPSFSAGRTSVGSASGENRQSSVVQPSAIS